MKPQAATAALTRIPKYADWLCAALALLAVWGNEYPVGIDLPQHGNLIGLWTRLGIGPIEFDTLYGIDWFTPYLLPYLVAFPFAKLFDGLVATKVLLTVAALGTPLAMRQWLAVVGADTRWSLTGYLVAFGFAYQWGFLAHMFALPFMFVYLAAFERCLRHPTWRNLTWTTLFGALVFFCHGITFGVAVLAAGLRLVLQRRPWRSWQTAIHFVALGALTLAWVRHREDQNSAPSVDWFITWDRATILLSGFFFPTASRFWAVVGGAAIALIVVFARPRLKASWAVWLPLALVTVGFLVLPEWLASTWLVGTRFCVYVHAFVFAPLLPRQSGWFGKMFPHLLTAVVAAGLLTLTVRLREFNRELDGFREITAAIPPHSDVFNFAPPTDQTSEVFGDMQYWQVPAWITTRQGGLINNDSAQYFQIPIQRHAVPFPSRYPYVVVRGDAHHLLAAHSAFPEAKLLKSSGKWHVLRLPEVQLPGLEVLRSAQEWGTLELNRAVTGESFSPALQPGLGTHARAFARVRARSPGSKLTGACTLNSTAGPQGRVRFRIRNDAREVLFDSGPMRAATPAKRFSVSLPKSREVLLEVLPLGTSAHDHANWVNLVVSP